MRIIHKIALLATAFLVLAASPLQARDKRIQVSGFGLLGSAELRNALHILEWENKPLSGRKIDDAAFLMLTRLKQSGYLDAALIATLRLADGSQSTASWTTDFEPQLEPDLEISETEFTVSAGLLYYYKDLSITGLTAIENEDALAYFIPNETLYSSRKDKSYSPSILANQKKQLIGGLALLGYADAQFVDTNVSIDRETGAATVELTIDQGRRYRVVERIVALSADANAPTENTESVDALYSRRWIDDQVRALRNESYRLGYPDTRISSKIVHAEPNGPIMEVTVRFEVQRGPKIILSDVEHRGASDTHIHLLQRKAKLQPGEPLDISEVEAARRSLSQLGIFRRIDLTYEPDGDGQRKAVFNYQNGERLEWQLLFGYGSYESFRGGILGERSNLFGRAHTVSFEAIKSVKSTEGKIHYTLPEILGETIDMRLSANLLDRQELYFDRSERGVSVGLSTHLRNLGTDIGLNYSFDRKRSSNVQAEADPAQIEPTNIGSISLRSSKNAVDNILYPTSGYELFGSFRYSDKILGGETDFLRTELGATYHAKWGSRWIAHFSAKAGHIGIPDALAVLPKSERFLIGGENTLRGFRRGEAGPIDDNGIPTDAEAYGLINAELEYPLIDKLNLVLFTDAARVWGSTDNLDLYDDYLNLGIGLRYKTIIGPIRLEYGHNIDPRPNDPKGTVHLSIGFPF